MKPFYLVFLLLFSFTVLKKLPKANQIVLEYVKSKMGVQVGTGECSDLIFNAQYEVRKSGVKSQNKVTTKNILPGDYISFRNVIIGNGRLVFTEHHAVVISLENTSIITIAHQNHNYNRTVQELSFDLKDITSGQFSITRP